MMIGKMTPTIFNVRFWLEADLPGAENDVRYAPDTVVKLISDQFSATMIRPEAIPSKNNLPV